MDDFLNLDPESQMKGVAAIDASEFLLKMLRTNHTDNDALVAVLRSVDDPRLMVRKLIALNRFRILTIKWLIKEHNLDWSNFNG